MSRRLQQGRAVLYQCRTVRSRVQETLGAVKGKSCGLKPQNETFALPNYLLAMVHRSVLSEDLVLLWLVRSEIHEVYENSIQIALRVLGAIRN